MRKFYFVFIILLPFIGYSQISTSELPKSKQIKLKAALIISKIDLDVNRDSLLSAVASQNSNKLKTEIYGKAIPVNLDLLKKSTVTDIQGGKLYQLTISCPGASALGLNFSFWKLPKNATLFVWKGDRSDYVGAFTSDNNKSWGGMMIRPVVGESIIIEYFEPYGTSTSLRVENVIYTLPFGSNDDSFGESAECQKDINSGEGQGWQNEKRSVVKVITEHGLGQMGGGWYIKYSGALINNTGNDAAPYLLTAEHCVNSDEYAQKSIYFFNYESTVTGEDGTKEQTIVGAKVMATKPDIDFCLLKLSVNVPEKYEAFFSGWEISDEKIDYAVSIHHPKGDVKKISKTNKGIEPYGAFNDELYPDEQHWVVSEWNVGISEGGSSGSPLYNSHHRIIGDLSGGASKCDNPILDSYEMFSIAWDSSDSYGQQLKHWLDPDESGVTSLDGYDPYPKSRVYMYPDLELCFVNEPITFINKTTGDYSDFHWDFGSGADPGTAEGDGPFNVVYTEPGVYTAHLIATNNSTGKDTLFVLDNYIHVYNRKATPSFAANVTEIYMDSLVTFTNQSTGTNTAYEWNFGDGADGALVTYDNGSINVRWSTPGQKTVTLVVKNPEGDKNMVKPMYVTVYEKVWAGFELDKDIYYVGDTVKVTNTSTTQKGYSSINMVLDGIGAWSTSQFIFYYKEGYVNYSYDNPWLKFTEPGEHTIKAVFSTVNQGFAASPEDPDLSYERTITIFPKMNIDFSVSNNSNNYSFSLTGTDIEDYTYSWDIDGFTYYGQSASYIFLHNLDYPVTLSVFDGDGKLVTKVKKTISVDTTITTVDDLDEIEIGSFSIWPNPFINYIRFELPTDNEQAEISLVDITGVTRYRGSSNQTTINTSNLRIGVYFLKIQNGNQTHVSKLIKR